MLSKILNVMTMGMMKKSKEQLPNIYTMMQEAKEAGSDTEKLQGLVQNHIKSIMTMLDTQQKKLDEAKSLAQSAKDIAKKDGFWNSINPFGTNIGKELSKATSNGLIATNEAVAEMNKVLQGVVALTLCSAMYAKIMIETMGGILKDGFINASGQRERLSNTQKEFVEHLIIATEEQAGQKLQMQQNAESIAQNRESINNNAQSILLNKDLIAQNAELIAQNQQKILELQKNTNKNLGILVWIALVLSITSLVVSLTDKF